MQYTTAFCNASPVSKADFEHVDGDQAQSKQSKSFRSTSRSRDKASRTRSQTVTSVRHVDLKVAVGRTMSLQASKQEMEALQRMTTAEEAEAMDALRALRALEEMEREEQEYLAGENRADDAAQGADHDADGDLHMLEEEIRRSTDSDSDSIPRPSSGLSKVLAALDEDTIFPYESESRVVPVSLNRANTFPAKLLSRRIESARQANKNVRRSEMLNGVYLRQSLFGGIGTEDTFPVSPTESDIYEARSEAPLPQHPGIPSPVKNRSRSLHELEDQKADSSLPFSPGWGYAEDLDAYYLGSGEEFEFGYFESDEEVDYRASSASDVPHIRVTAH